MPDLEVEVVEGKPPTPGPSDLEVEDLLRRPPGLQVVVKDAATNSFAAMASMRL
jgi:hypothetical protein